MVESTVQGWGAGNTGAPQSDYQVRRIGANPPPVLRDLRGDVERSILAATGIWQSVLNPSDAAGAREGFRQFLHATIIPTAHDVGRQLARQFDTNAFVFNFDRLMASDIQGRARAFQSMVKAGMPLVEAARLSGLLDDD